MFKYEFRGSGLSCFWLFLWTTVVSIITLGLFFPWAYSALQRWIAANTYVNGQRLAFHGTGVGFFAQWLVILILTTITFGLYGPWGYCRLKRWEINNLSIAVTDDGNQITH